MIVNDSTYSINFPNKTFTDVWDNAADFVKDYENSGLYVNDMKPVIEQLFYLLYARYGNSVLANNDENQFKYRVYSTIYMYGPTWAKRLEIQNKIRSLSISDLQQGTKAINNHAQHDGSAPSTSTLEELPAIDAQDTTQYKKGVAEAYMTLLELLRTDVTKEFIDRFSKLFTILGSAPYAQYYISERMEDGET